LQGRATAEQCATLGVSRVRIEIEHAYGPSVTRAQPSCAALAWSLALPAGFYRAKIAVLDRDARVLSKPAQVSFEVVGGVHVPVSVDFPAAAFLSPSTIPKTNPQGGPS
jgi:hypothetical protein